jgi:uncharacterized Ntn-hydrolase superfamily protein
VGDGIADAGKVPVTNEERVGAFQYTDLRIDALRCHVDDLERLVNEQVIALDKATVIAKDNMERRLDSMNEFREALRDTQARFLTSQEFDNAHAQVMTDIKMLREEKARMEGKASQSQVLGTAAISIVGLVIGVISLFR